MTTAHRLGGIRALLIALLAVAAAALLPGSAPAAPAAVGSSVGPDVIVPETHRCQNFGSTNPAGYRAGHCADVDLFENSLGIDAYRGQGQSFCQRASSGVIVQCIGIRQVVAIVNVDTGETKSNTYTCGSYGGGSCPAIGRFQNLSNGIYAECYQDYKATVQTTLKLPGDAGVRTSGTFSSYSTTYYHPVYC